MQKFNFTRISSNVKTGPIPVTMTSRASCPSNCGLSGSGCYAESGHVRLHWNRADGPQKASNGALGNFSGAPLATLASALESLPKGQLWRHNVAGDLVHHNQLIDAETLLTIVKANHKKRGFTYTHHKVLGDDSISRTNASLIKLANDGGFTVNLSADTLGDADKLLALNIGPVVTLLPIDAPNLSYTQAGNPVVKCPAVDNDNVQCSTCALCANVNRRSIVGFPVHGTSKKKADAVRTGNKVIPIAKG